MSDENVHSDSRSDCPTKKYMCESCQLVPKTEGKKSKSSQMKNKNCHLLKCLLTELRSGRSEIQMVFTFIIWTVHDMDSGNAPLEKGLNIKS